MLSAFILAVVLDFIISPYEVDTLGCESESTRLENVAYIRLYGGQRWQPVTLIRQRPAIPGPDTLIVEDSDPGWSYWVTVVDQAGNESCRGRGITVGIPPVSVPYAPWEREAWIDLSGRRIYQKPTTPGIYWQVKPGARPRRVVVL